MIWNVMKGWTHQGFYQTQRYKVLDAMVSDFANVRKYACSWKNPMNILAFIFLNKSYRSSVVSSKLLHVYIAKFCKVLTWRFWTGNFKLIPDIQEWYYKLLTNLSMPDSKWSSCGCMKLFLSKTVEIFSSSSDENLHPHSILYCEDMNLFSIFLTILVKVC